MQQTELMCPIHSRGGAGHDTNFPFRILMALVNAALKMTDKCDCDGRKGRVEIYVCGALIEMGVRKVMTNRQTSCIFSTRVESSPYSKLVSFTMQRFAWQTGAVVTLAQDINLRM